MSALYDALAAALRAGDPVGLAEVTGGPEGLIGAKLAVFPGPPERLLGSLGDPHLDRAVAEDVRADLVAGATRDHRYGLRGEPHGRDLVVFVESFVAPARMVIVGAVAFTGALTAVAKVLGYRVTVCDPRPVFATFARFPSADEVVVDQPGRVVAAMAPSLGPRDAVCVLTHDPKFDVPAIAAAIGTAVGYIGALGSRRTHRERLERLRAGGADECSLHRVMAPIGLDIGASTPEEAAVAVCAEIIAVRRGHPGASLRDGKGPIHRQRGGPA